MTCRHAPGDMSCSKNNPPDYSSSSTSSYSSYSQPATPDKNNYEIEDVLECGPHLVMKVKYPNCRNCSYEGSKVMVFLHTKPIDAMRWREIDPHFRDPKTVWGKKQAPSPAARFPGSAEGWSDAISYANSKSRVAK